MISCVVKSPRDNAYEFTDNYFETELEKASGVPISCVHIDVHAMSKKSTKFL